MQKKTIAHNQIQRQILKISIDEKMHYFERSHNKTDSFLRQKMKTKRQSNATLSILKHSDCQHQILQVMHKKEVM